MALDDSGQVLVKGVGVFTRYWNDPGATQESFVDGWFKTGDLGSIDDDGYLSIIGRAKEILVTAGGKNVSPAGTENAVSALASVGQCMLVGDGRPFISALVTMDPDERANGRRPDEAKLLREITAAFQECNSALSRPEQVKKFIVLDGDFSEDNGMVTPSLKVKRHEVEHVYRKQIESLYRSAGHDIPPV